MKKALPIVITAIVVGVIGFFGGVKYGKTATPQVASAGANFVAFRNQQGTGSGATAGGAGRRNGQSGGFVAGKILSKDDTSITLELGGGAPGGSGSTASQGGSRIVFVSNTAQVMKTVPGTLDDLAIGEQVLVTGSANSDGSLTAQSVQIRQ